MRSLNIMVVDDSRLGTEVVKNLLKDLGHAVVQTARNGIEAIDLYGTCCPDVVTMDITMPGMDGIQATQKLLQKYPDARIVMLTSHAQQGMVVDAMKAGAKSYLLKPIKSERLQATLKEVTAETPVT